MTRKQRRLDQLRAIEREYKVALATVKSLEERFRKNPSELDDEQLRFRDFQNFRENLESTYLIRMFAEFEAGLREVWEHAFRRKSHPRVHELSDSLATRCLIPEDWRDHTHAVRSYRNSLVHEGGGEPPVIGIEVARGDLCRFLSALPHRW
jgi:hypothetical protein